MLLITVTRNELTDLQELHDIVHGAPQRQLRGRLHIRATGVVELGDLDPVISLLSPVLTDLQKLLDILRRAQQGRLTRILNTRTTEIHHPAGLNPAILIERNLPTRVQERLDVLRRPPQCSLRSIPNRGTTRIHHARDIHTVIDPLEDRHIIEELTDVLIRTEKSLFSRLLDAGTAGFPDLDDLAAVCRSVRILRRNGGSRPE